MTSTSGSRVHDLIALRWIIAICGFVKGLGAENKVIRGIIPIFMSLRGALLLFATKQSPNNKEIAHRTASALWCKCRATPSHAYLRTVQAMTLFFESSF